MEILQSLNLFPCRPAHNPYRTRCFKCPVRSKADKGYFLVSLWDFLRPRQTVNLVIGAVFLFDLQVVIEAVQFSVAETIFVLLGFGCFEDCRKSIAEIYSTDFLTLRCSNLGLVPCSVGPHTAAYRQILLLKVDVLPSEGTDLPDTQACVIGYLYRQECRIVFLFQKVL